VEKEADAMADEGGQTREQRAPVHHTEQQTSLSTEMAELPANETAFAPGQSAALLTDPHLNGRGNGPVRGAVMRQAQQTVGNRALRRFVQRATASGAPDTQPTAVGSVPAVQREGEDGGAPAPQDAGLPGGVTTPPPPPPAIVATLQNLVNQTPPNVAQIEAAIRTTPAADLPAVTSNIGLMNDLKTKLSAADFQTVSQMLSGGLLGQKAFTNTTDTGNAYTSNLALLRSGLSITKDVKFSQSGTFAAGKYDALKARVIAAVTSFLSGKFKLKIETPGGTPQEGDGEYPITVQVVDNASGTYPVTLHGGAHGRSGMGQAGGNIYELGQGSETSVPDIVLAHESAHMVLGASDEYPSASVPARKLFTDHSLMGNFYTEGTAAAEIKARHFQFLVTQVATWFPGRTITIVK